MTEYKRDCEEFLQDLQEDNSAYVISSVYRAIRNGRFE